MGMPVRVRLRAPVSLRMVRLRVLAPTTKESCMSKQDETLQRAYGNVPKEVGYSIDWNFVPTWRGIKYYWHKLIRKVTR